MKDDMLALAARVEALSDPDKATFWQAFRRAYPKPARIWEDEDREEWTAEYSNWQEQQRKFANFLDVRAWLDAAMMLVPEGWVVGEMSWWPHARSSTVHMDDMHDRKACSGAQSLPLALCAASLRARASMGGE